MKPISLIAVTPLAVAVPREFSAQCTRLRGVLVQSVERAFALDTIFSA